MLSFSSKMGMREPAAYWLKEIITTSKKKDTGLGVKLRCILKE